MNFSDKLFCAKKGYIHRKIANEDVLISVGSGIANFNGYILLNSTASFLWDMLKEARNIRASFLSYTVRNHTVHGNCFFFR